MGAHVRYLRVVGVSADSNGNYFTLISMKQFRKWKLLHAYKREAVLKWKRFLEVSGGSYSTRVYYNYFSP